MPVYFSSIGIRTRGRRAWFIGSNPIACNCSFVDKTSKGIFRWDGDVIEIRAPAPGDPRATEFDDESGETMRLVREGD